MLRDSPALAFVLRGPEHTVEVMNPAFLALIGQRADDIVGRRFAEALPEQAARYLATFDRVFATGEPFAGQEVLAQTLSGDGQPVARYFNYILVPLRSLAGEIEGIMNFGFDVTEQVAARQKSQELERRYRFVLDALPTLAWTTDGSRIDYVNRQWTEYSGHDFADPASIDWQTFIHPDDQHVLAGWDARSAAPWSSEYRLRRHDGVYRWFLGRSVAFLDGEGRPTRHFGTATEIHEQKEAEARQRALASVIAHIADAQSASQVARAACSAGRAALDARSAIMWTREADGFLQMLASDGVPDDFAEHWRRVPPERDTPLRRAIESRTAVWVENAEDYQHAAPDIYASAADAGRATAFATVPLTVEGKSLGAITFSYPGDHHFSDQEKQFIAALSTHLAHALDRARALEAERLASGRVALLATAGVVLSASLDFRETLQNLSRVVVPAFADWCAIDLVIGGEIERVAVHHVDPARVELAFEVARRYPDRRGDGSSVNTVIDEKKTVWVAHITDEMLAGGARDATHREILSSLDIASVIQVPLVVEGQAMGVVSFINDARRPFDAIDCQFAEELGRRAAGAIANALLFGREHEARQALRRANERLALLARAGETFSSSIDYDETLYNVVATAMPMLADFCFFDVIEGDSVRRIPGAHEDPEVLALVAASRWAGGQRTDVTALSTNETGLHPEIDEAWLQRVASDAEHLDVLRRLQLCSLLTVPLRTGGELRGALTLCFGKSGRHHVPDDVTLAQELARRAAIAVEQARLYRDARAAALRAEEANRFKDEFLATVSHELRTPLNAIMGWSSMLRGEPPDRVSVERGLDVIHRNAVSQARIINDILDVSRIVTGKLKIGAKPVDLVALVREAIDVVRPSADAKGIEIAVESEEPEVTIVGDPERLRQVAWNLLSNAVKFTGAGGHVRVSVERHEGHATICVRDDGRGIAADFLPLVFERFRQADSSSTRQHGGLGLGLAIVRHIVELHGGTVAAESPGLGGGATFRVVLPVRAVLPPRAEVDEGLGPPHSARLLGPAASIAGRRILVVDDDRDARELIEAVLIDAGAVVRAVSSVREGLTALAEHHPDVLVSDIGMPGEDGYSFIRSIRALSRSQGGAVAAVALTAYARAEDRVRLLAAGFNNHVAKPVHADELLGVIASLLLVVPPGA